MKHDQTPQQTESIEKPHSKLKQEKKTTANGKNRKALQQTETKENTKTNNTKEKQTECAKPQKVARSTSTDSIQQCTGCRR